jgi:hypothetical protein
MYSSEPLDYDIDLKIDGYPSFPFQFGIIACPSQAVAWKILTCESLVEGKDKLRITFKFLSLSLMHPHSHSFTEYSLAHFLSLILFFLSLP